MIHDVYRTRNLVPTSPELQPTDEMLPLDTHKIFSFVNAALSEYSIDHVLLGDFNIHHPSWGGPRARSHRASQLLLSLQELHNVALLLPPETITCRKNGSESTIVLVFPSSHFSNTQTAFSFSPLVSPFVPKLQWRKADKVALAMRARELDLMPRNYKNCEDIDEGVERLVRWIKEAVA